jgi:hypothetical protein
MADEWDAEDPNGYVHGALAHVMVRAGIADVARLKATHRAVDYGSSGNCLFQSLQKTLARHFGARGELRTQTALRAFLHGRLTALSRLPPRDGAPLDGLDLHFRRLVVNDLLAAGDADDALSEAPLDSPELDAALVGYLADIRRPNVWGGVAVLFAVADWYDVAIQLVTMGDGSHACVNAFGDPWIGLVHVGYDHYRAVIPNGERVGDGVVHPWEGAPLTTAPARPVRGRRA